MAKGRTFRYCYGKAAYELVAVGKVLTYAKLLKPESYPSFLSFTIGYLVALPVTAYVEHISTLFLIFVSFSVLLYPGIYLINDLIDLSRDCRHPTKRYRPLASGIIGPIEGRLFLIALILLGLVLGYFISAEVLFFELVFLFWNLFYTLVAKNIPYLDLFWVMSTHPLRVVFAICVFGQLEAKQWPFLVAAGLVHLGFNSLKRHEELVDVELPCTIRPVLKWYSREFLLYTAIFCCLALPTLFFWAHSLLAFSVVAYCSAYYLTLLLTYFRGPRLVKRLSSYVLTN